MIKHLKKWFDKKAKKDPVEATAIPVPTSGRKYCVAVANGRKCRTTHFDAVCPVCKN